MGLKHSLKELLRTMGVFVSRKPPEVLSEHLRVIFRRLGINCVIDVGGHYGEYGDFLRKLGYKGRVVSFEPTTGAFEKLSQRAASDENWRIFKYALGAAEGQREINVARYSVFNSFFTRTQFSHDQFREQSEVVSRETVKMKTLDRMFEQCVEGIEKPTIYLKLDTQGYDLEVLRGANRVIGRIAAMQSEVSVKPIYVNMPSFHDAIGHYLNLGFEITGLFPVTRDANCCVIEFDCVMLRKLG